MISAPDPIDTLLAFAALEPETNAVEIVIVASSPGPGRLGVQLVAENQLRLLLPTAGVQVTGTAKRVIPVPPINPATDRTVRRVRDGRLSMALKVIGIFECFTRFFSSIILLATDRSFALRFRLSNECYLAYCFCGLRKIVLKFCKDSPSHAAVSHGIGKSILQDSMGRQPEKQKTTTSNDRLNSASREPQADKYAPPSSCLYRSEKCDAHNAPRRRCLSDAAQCDFLKHACLAHPTQAKIKRHRDCDRARAESTPSSDWRDDAGKMLGLKIPSSTWPHIAMARESRRVARRTTHGRR